MTGAIQNTVAIDYLRVGDQDITVTANPLGFAKEPPGRWFVVLDGTEIMLVLSPDGCIVTAFAKFFDIERIR